MSIGNKKGGAHSGKGRDVASQNDQNAPEEEGDKLTVSQGGGKSLFGKKGGGTVGSSSNPKDWNFRAELIPQSIVTRNKDRVVSRVMVFADLVAVALVIVVVFVMMGVVHVANNRVTKANNQHAQLVDERAQYKDVEDTLNAYNDELLVNVAVLYNEVNWRTVAEDFTNALPEGGKYTSLTFSEYQLTGAGTGASGSSNATVWSTGGVITVSFTVTDPELIKAEDFIKNFMNVNGYIDGSVSSITQDSATDTGASYTYTGIVSMHLVTTGTDENGNTVDISNTTDRSNSSAINSESNQALLAKMRQDIEDEAAGRSRVNTSVSQASSDNSTDIPDTSASDTTE